MKAIDNSNHNNGFYEYVDAAVLDWILHYRITNQLLFGYIFGSSARRCCDELETGLLRSQADSEKLMEAVVSIVSGADCKSK
jgi:hypothetical protein